MIHMGNDTDVSDVLRVLHDLPNLFYCEVNHNNIIFVPFKKKWTLYSPTFR